MIGDEDDRPRFEMTAVEREEFREVNWPVRQPLDIVPDGLFGGCMRRFEALGAVVLREYDGWVGFFRDGCVGRFPCRHCWSLWGAAVAVVVVVAVLIP